MGQWPWGSTPHLEGSNRDYQGSPLAILPHPFAESLQNSMILHQITHFLEPLHTQALSNAH